MNSYDKTRSNFPWAIAVATLCLLMLSAIKVYASEALVEKYQALAKQQGMEFTYGEFVSNGDNSFTLNDVAINGPESDAPVRIKRVSISGVEELTGNGLSADRIEISGLSYSSKSQRGEEVFVTLAAASMNGVFLPDASDTDAPLFVHRDYAVSASDFNVTVDGNLAVSIPTVDSKFNSPDGRKQFTGFMKIADVEFFPEATRSQQMISQLEALGHKTLKMDINLEADMDMDTGLMDLKRYEFDIQDMGALNIAIKIGGYTEAFAKQLRNESYRINLLPLAERQKESMAMMSKMGELTLQNMRISFKDNSITNKIVAMQAQASGQSADDMKMMAPMMLGASLQALDKPEFTAMLVGAVQTFLANPGTIAISANPERAVSFGEMMGMGMSVPNLLIDTLNIKAEAQNE